LGFSMVLCDCVVYFKTLLVDFIISVMTLRAVAVWGLPRETAGKQLDDFRLLLGLLLYRICYACVCSLNKRYVYRKEN